MFGRKGYYGIFILYLFGTAVGHKGVGGSLEVAEAGGETQEAAGSNLGVAASYYGFN